MVASIDQPTIRRENRSSTTARYSHPSAVGKYVMPAAHATFGPDGVKSRSNTLAATGRSCRESVVRTNRFAVRPRIPCVFIRVATKFSAPSKPRWFNSAVMRGLP